MTKVLVIGDLMEDVIIIPESTARANTDIKAKITKTLGGQAANVAAWLSHLETKVELVASVNQDEFKQIKNNLESSGVKPNLQKSPKPSGSLAVLVEGESRTMFSDRGANSDLDLSLIDLEDCSVVYLSGYALLEKTIKEVHEFIDKAKSKGILTALDPGSYGFIEDYGVSEFREIAKRFDLAFPNQEEEELLGLSGELPVTVITMSSAGAKLTTNKGLLLQLAANPTTTIDPTGAGDAFAAGFLSELAREPSLDPEVLEKALNSAIQAGSRAIEVVGARP
jgi:sugar/nucleoside kinase (ribokinase family)